MTFSLCMIVKNEERLLGRCLDSVSGVFDEIVITDTGSVDSTKKLALSYTDKVYSFAWCDDFSAARNFSFSKATGDYIFWLDADDVLSPANRDALASLKQTITPETDVVMMKYASADHPDFFYYRERLIKRLGGMRWVGFVHEVIPPKGKLLYADITVLHKPDSHRRDPGRNLRLYEARLAAGAKLSTREQYYYARELYDNGKRDLAARHFEQFLKLPNAWYADKISACLVLYDIYRHKLPAKARDFLAMALSYDCIHPQVLCLMGDEQRMTGRTEQAIFWYESALRCPTTYRKNGFVLTDYERYYPYLQLCVCYDALGDRETAAAYNRLAGAEHPDSAQVKYNEAYFAAIKRAEQTDAPFRSFAAVPETAPPATEPVSQAPTERIQQPEPERIQQPETENAADTREAAPTDKAAQAQETGKPQGTADTANAHGAVETQALPLPPKSGVSKAKIEKK